MSRLQDFSRFARLQVSSGDIDPAYPVLRHLCDHLCDDEGDAAAFVVLYVAYYNLTSALDVWLDGWHPGMPLTDVQMRLPTGTERRAHRDVRQFARHIASLSDLHARYGSLAAYLAPSGVDDPHARWAAVQGRLQGIYGNGRWAGYKTGEILDTVLGWNCPPPDAGHASSSGPRHGLADLFPATATLTGNDPTTIARLDAYTDELVTVTGLPVAQVETALCDFHSAIGGRYYVGHDVDQQLEQTARCQNERVHAEILAARSAVFHPGWLGEIAGWPGVRRNLKRLYADTGVIDWRDTP